MVETMHVCQNGLRMKVKISGDWSCSIYKEGRKDRHSLGRLTPSETTMDKFTARLNTFFEFEGTKCHSHGWVGISFHRSG